MPGLTSAVRPGLRKALAWMGRATIRASRARTPGRCRRLAFLGAVLMVPAVLAGCGTSAASGVPMNPSKLTAEVQSEAHGGHVHVQGILFSHPNQQRVDVAWVFLVRNRAGKVEIIDNTGQRYTGGRKDFLAHNHLFTSRDTLSLPADFPSLSTGDGRDIDVPGHTSPSYAWAWWLAGAVAVVAIAMAVAVVRFRRTQNPMRPATPADADGTDALPGA